MRTIADLRLVPVPLASYSPRRPSGCGSSVPWLAEPQCRGPQRRRSQIEREIRRASRDRARLRARAGPVGVVLRSTHLPRPIFDAVEGGGSTGSGIWRGGRGGVRVLASVVPVCVRTRMFVEARDGARVSVSLGTDGGRADRSASERLSPHCAAEAFGTTRNSGA